jgi:hypothetical protein
MSGEAKLQMDGYNQASTFRGERGEVIKNIIIIFNVQKKEGIHIGKIVDASDISNCELDKAEAESKD